MSIIRRFFSTSLTYPKIYHKFSALDLDGKTKVEYRIQDFPQDRFAEGVEFTLNHFFAHEPMSKTRNIINDKVACQEFSDVLTELLKKNCSLICLKENSDEIVSANIMCVKNEEEYYEDYEVKSKHLSDILGTITFANTKFNPFKHYNVDKLLYALTVTVHPAYRGRSVANQMFKTRRILTKELGLKVTTTHATAGGSQKAAKNAGFEENFVITYEELEKLNPRFHFPGIDTKYFKVMSFKI
ncbi:hypothetical protein PVAND_015597 [Polypedilum vanderplanki]|uniref:N-acetyltransferase domain-containing protein n=1 Tax=Polypedilum vanderplanki TaxID=319348 RepID=A0A9J6BDC2_POLVA|nr:hypothetical protein PVAND_015597 [Polypedilum vanderplanki]